jgi:hypothetical protein
VGEPGSGYITEGEEKSLEDSVGMDDADHMSRSLMLIGRFGSHDKRTDDISPRHLIGRSGIKGPGLSSSCARMFKRDCNEKLRNIFSHTSVSKWIKSLVNIERSYCPC